MNNLIWTDYELKLLEEWDWVISYIESVGYINADDSDFERKFLLESKLLINNKYCVVYSSEEKVPLILTFYDYTQLRRDSNIKKYHPLNFSSFSIYRNYITETRESLMF